jgi:hypothetical protein
MSEFHCVQYENVHPLALTQLSLQDLALLSHECLLIILERLYQERPLEWEQAMYRIANLLQVPIFNNSHDTFEATYNRLISIHLDHVPNKPNNIQALKNYVARAGYMGGYHKSTLTGMNQDHNVTGEPLHNDDGPTIMENCEIGDIGAAWIGTFKHFGMYICSVCCLVPFFLLRYLS